MTELLDKAFAEVSRLPEAEQDAFAAWILEELAAERRWESRFAASADILEPLADEPLTEEQAGRTGALHPGER